MTSRQAASPGPSFALPRPASRRAGSTPGVSRGWGARGPDGGAVPGPRGRSVPLSRSRKPGPGPGRDRRAGSHHGQRTCGAGRAARQPSRACGGGAARPRHRLPGPAAVRAWPGCCSHGGRSAGQARCRPPLGPVAGAAVGAPAASLGAAAGSGSRPQTAQSASSTATQGRWPRRVTRASPPHFPRLPRGHSAVSGAGRASPLGSAARWGRQPAGVGSPLGSTARWGRQPGVGPRVPPSGPGAGCRDPPDIALSSATALRPLGGRLGVQTEGARGRHPEPRPPPSVRSCVWPGPGAAQSSGGETRGDDTGV